MKNNPLFLFLLIIITGVWSGGCANDDEAPAPAADPLTIAINTNTSYQTIAGFGGSNRMWGTQFLEPAGAEKAFSTGENGLGLSIFRVRIASSQAVRSISLSRRYLPLKLMQRH